jgi:hypothetical protein
MTVKGDGAGRGPTGPCHIWRKSMTKSDHPTFFVPRVDEDKQEERFALMAKTAGIAVPPVDERIYSITFTSNSETWLATVGEELRGSVTRTQKSLGQKVERKALLSNGSTVMAIFAGNPYQVFHDNASRVWANPFLVGSPTSVARFKGQSPAGSQAS